MGFFSKLAKLDPLAGRAIKDTAKVTSAVAKVSGGKDIAAKTLAKDVNKVARATGAIKATTASAQAMAAKPAPKPVTKPAPKPAAKPAAKPIRGQIPGVKPGDSMRTRMPAPAPAQRPGPVVDVRTPTRPTKPSPAARPMPKPITKPSTGMQNMPKPVVSGGSNASKPAFGTVAHMQSLRGKTGSR